MKPNDSAFPIPAQDMQSLGMTLRDYFAAQAMQGFITTAGAPCLNGLDGYESGTAEAAYKLADALLEARAASNAEVRPS